MSHIAIIGATGRAGGRLLEEALRRGHTVTAIARKASEKLSGRTNVKAIDLDVLDSAALEKALAGHDAVFSAAHFSTVPPAAIIEPAKRAGVKRLLVVGGAGSLFAAPGLKVIDTPNFPEAYKAEATAGGVFLEALRNEKELDWTFLALGRVRRRRAHGQVPPGQGRPARERRGAQLDHLRGLRDRVHRRARKTGALAPALHHRVLINGRSCSPAPPTGRTARP